MSAYLEAVRILAGAAWADGQIGEEESELVRQMIEVGPLSDDDKATARAWLHSRVHIDESSLAKLTLERRKDLFLSAVRVTGADGRTVRQERGFLDRLRDALGLDEETAKEIRHEVREAALLARGRYNKLFRLPTHTLEGELTSLTPYRGQVVLIVNVASECGFTPQYEDLQKLYERYKDDGFSVIAFPCNQFGEQEPGEPEQIREFCTTNYGITFPIMEKLDVKGDRQDEIYALLSEVADADGEAGEVQWNFEKFVVSADANTVTRFRSKTKPFDDALVAAIEAGLPK